MPPMPARRRKRTGHDTLRDLADAPRSLRNIAAFPSTMSFPAQGDADTIGQDDLHRWAFAIDEILNFKTWKGFAWLLGAAAAGYMVGLVMGLIL